MIAPMSSGQATPLCYASSERMNSMSVDFLRGVCVAILAAFLGGGVPASLCSQQVGAQNAAPAETAQNVNEVRLVTEDGQVLASGPSVSTVETGKPLDRAQVAASLRALYKTGNYSNIRVLSQNAAGGIRVDFVVQENLYFNQLLVFGLKAPPTAASAAAEMQITLGHVFRKETLDDAAERLKVRLQEEGLYTAKVDTELRPHPAA